MCVSLVSGHYIHHTEKVFHQTTFSCECLSCSRYSNVLLETLVQNYPEHFHYQCTVFEMMLPLCSHNKVYVRLGVKHMCESTELYKSRVYLLATFLHHAIVLSKPSDKDTLGFHPRVSSNNLPLLFNQ